VAGDFAPAAPNPVWAGDVTDIATSEGWAYLAVLLDLFSRRAAPRRAVAWALSANNDTALALAALHRAVRGRRFVPAGLVHHTDRGSPCASDDYRAALVAHAMVASKIREGDCWDNASSESFFATLRAELVGDERYPTLRAELVGDERYPALRAAETSIGDYIESFYNVERFRSNLDYVSAIEFELKMQMSVIAAWSDCPPKRGRISPGGPPKTTHDRPSTTRTSFVAPTAIPLHPLPRNSSRSSNRQWTRCSSRYRSSIRVEIRP